MTRFSDCLAFTLAEEGGFVNDPRDPGGATNKGITLATYRAFKPGVTVYDLRAISPLDVQQIYFTKFWQPLRCDELPLGVDLMVFDMGVNAGVGEGEKLLQTALNVKVDGELGPITMAAVKALNPAALLALLAMAETTYYHALKGFVTFGSGWEHRLTRRVIRAVTPVS